MRACREETEALKRKGLAETAKLHDYQVCILCPGKVPEMPASRQ